MQLADMQAYFSLQYNYKDYQFNYCNETLPISNIPPKNSQNTYFYRTDKTLIKYE